MLKIRGIMLALLAIVVAVLLLTKDVWYFGVTRYQTASILLEGGKYSRVAIPKAIWHGEDIFTDVLVISENLRSFNRNGAKNLVEVIERINISSSSPPRIMEVNSNDYQKLFVFMMLARTSKIWWGDDIENTKTYLLSIISRSIEKEPSEAVQNYEFEIAVMLLGNSELFIAEEDLLNLLFINNLPYSYHATVCKALMSYIDSEKVKVALIERFLDVDFYAAIPAYKVLSSTISKEKAQDLLNERLALNIPNDEAYLLL